MSYISAGDQAPNQGTVWMATARINSALIRRINTGLVFHALREHPGSTQRRLATLTRLDAATVSTIVGQLAADGLIRRATHRPRGRAGRPERTLDIAPDAGWLIGVELDTEVIRLLAAGLDGEPRVRLEIAGSLDVETTLTRLQQGVTALLGECGATWNGVHGIGIGLPGLIDNAGKLVLAPNLKWRDPAIPVRLGKLFPVPVQVDNDTKLASRAEHLFGACRGIGDFIVVYGHSGIGGSLYLGGEIYRGISGLAGEFGHMKVVPGGRACGCGGRGCLEAYVSEWAIRTQLAEAGCRLPDMAAVARAAEAGDPIVAHVLAEAGAQLGMGLANLINTMNPRRIVLGGNLAVLGRHLLPAARRTLGLHALEALSTRAEIVISSFGQDAVPLGGVALAMAHMLPLPGAFALRPVSG